MKPRKNASEEWKKKGVFKMKPIKQFQIGSSYFFSSYPDYKSKDNDELCIMDEFPFKENVMNVKLNHKDIFLFRDMPKSGYINDLVKSNTPMKIGKFLIPEFCSYIGFTIEDLKSIFHIFDNIDSKHTYEKIIAQSYIENNDFFLTTQQRDLAYDEYKSTRL